MYKDASAISYIVRAYVCYLTIQATPIFANPAVEWLLGQIISIFVILMVISYAIVNKMGYESGQAPVLGVVLYFGVYVVLTLITWVFLLLMTKFGILPI